MANIIQNGPVSIYQDIELSLTEHLVPPVVHVKQFDHKSRKVRCTLYANAVEYTIQSISFWHTRYPPRRTHLPVQHGGADQRQG